jgi:predicted metal-dependent hydrolase
MPPEKGNTSQVIHMWSKLRHLRSSPIVKREYGAVMEAPEVEVRRSLRRRRTVTAFREDGRVVVCLPSRLSKAEERRWVQVMLERLAAQERRRRPSDEALLARARELSKRYLDGRAKPASVRWSAAQRSRWGSCTPSDASIRLSGRLRGLPTWVIDYVLVHELAHLLVTDHGEKFWELVSRYPRAERARGFLDGVSHAAGMGPDSDEASDVEPGEVETGDVETGDIETGDVESDEVETGDVETGDVESDEVETGDVETGESAV